MIFDHLISRRRALQGLAAAATAPVWRRAVAMAAALRPGSRGITDTSRSAHVRLRSVDMDSVQWKGGFWAERFALAHEVMIPTMWEVLNMPDNGATMVTFAMAAGGPPIKNYVTPYSDGDCYKWLEAVAHVYAVTHDPALDARMDGMIALVAKAQAQDGYISTPVQIRHGKRWERIQNHELYNMGHLMTAAVIHHRATGKTTLLVVATRAADYLYTTFSPRPPALAHFGFNPSQIMGLVELYRETGNPRYLELARIFIDNRGSRPGGSDQNQDRTPLRQANEAVGHAVLAGYLYAGAADTVAETEDAALRAALDRLWNDVAYRKLYVTGAIGAKHSGISSALHGRGDAIHEGFGLDYELPNRTAYNETCANIANAMWNWRMLSLTGEAKYADMMERVFYNSMLSGVSLDGKDFFYTNVLRREASLPMLSNDTLARWPNTAIRRTPGRATSPAFCCPPNALRMLASMHEYMYSLSNDTVWVHFYAPSELKTEWRDGRKVSLLQKTEFPWDGRIVLTVGPESTGKFTLKLRIPSWAAGATLKVNGKSAIGPVTPGSYAELTRRWSPGDAVTLEMPMEPRLVVGSPHVDETRGQVAVMRGPMVYCLESPDLPEGTTINDWTLTEDSLRQAEWRPDLLHGVMTVNVRAVRVNPAEAESIYPPLTKPRAETTDLQMIPYYAWSNRGVSSMTVWLPLRGGQHANRTSSRLS